MEETQVQVWRVTVTQERCPLRLIKGMPYRNSVQTHNQSFTAEPWHLQLSLRSYWYVSCINSPAGNNSAVKSGTRGGFTAPISSAFRYVRTGSLRAQTTFFRTGIAFVCS